MPPHPIDVVDVLDVDRALLDARPAVGAGPDHVRVDYTVHIRAANERPFGFGQHRRRQLGALLVGGGQQVRCLGERVVAQVQDDLLGRQRLAGRPGRALGLAAPALGAGRHVQQALPGEVLDLAQAEHIGIGVGLLEVQHLPVAAHGLQAAERVRAAREQHVERGQHDVQVLGVGDEHPEAEDDRELGQDEHRLQHAIDPAAQGVQPVPDDLRGERAVRVREHPGVDLRPAVQQQGSDNEENSRQDEPGRAGVAAGEPGRPPLSLRAVAQPDDSERDEAGQHQDGEQVLEEAQRERMPDPRDRELPVEQITVGLDDREDQDDEAPERDEVRQAGHRPLEQLPLPEDLRGLHFHVSANVRADRLDPLRRGLPGQAELAQPPQPTARDHGRGHGHQQTKDDSQGHGGPPPAASAASVRRWLPPVLARLTACRPVGRTSAAQHPTD